MNYIQTFIWLDGCIDAIDTLGANNENINKVWPLIKSHVKNCLCSCSDKSYPKHVDFINELKGYINFTAQFEKIGLSIWDIISKRVGELEIPKEQLYEQLLPNKSNIPLPRGFNESTVPCTPPYTLPEQPFNPISLADCVGQGVNISCKL